MKKRQVSMVALVTAAVMAITATPVHADATSGAAWLATQQQADGGFEVAGFAGFETADVILALAESAQTGGTWDAAPARSAVSTVATDAGLTPFDAIDAEAEAGPSAGGAAKLITLVAAPGGWADGLSPVAFDPGHDGAAVDLVSTMTAGQDAGTGLYGTFGDTLLAVLAQRQLCLDIPAATVAALVAAGAPSGGWNFAGDPTDNVFDPDITGRTLQALAAAGVPADDTAVAAGLRRLALEHDTATGGWISFGEANPNSTAMAILGLDAYGIDAATRAWRDDLAPERVADPYPAPEDYLLGQQQADGRIASPSDSFGVNTFATSQGVQALTRRWDWTAPADCPDLSAPAPPTSSTTIPPTTTAPVTTVPVTAPTTAPATATPTAATVKVAGTSTTATATLATSGSSSWGTVLLAALMVLLGVVAVRVSGRMAPARRS
jgi:hypothetical protein